MGIRQVGIGDADKVAPLIAKFRVELQAYKQIRADENIEAAKEEFAEYINAGYPVYVYEGRGQDQCAGYAVCRVDGPVVWLESLFVLREHRRAGVASALFGAAEQLAASYGEETMYVYVHPNNDGMFAFLRKQEYNVLNLIEVRKKYEGETIREQIDIRGNSFDY